MLKRRVTAPRVVNVNPTNINPFKQIQAFKNALTGGSRGTSVAKTAGMTKGMAGIARKPMGGIGGGKPLAGVLSNPGRGRGSLPPQNVFPSPKKTSGGTGIGNLVKQTGKLPPEVVRRMGLGGGKGPLPQPMDRDRPVPVGLTKRSPKQPGTMPQGFRPGVTPPPRAMASQKPMLKKGGTVKKAAAKSKTK